MGDGVDGDLVTLVGELVHHGVVGVLVRHVKGAVDRTSCGVLVTLLEQPLLRKKHFAWG